MLIYFVETPTEESYRVLYDYYGTRGNPPFPFS